MKIGDFNIVNNKCEKLLGITLIANLLLTAMYQICLKTLDERLMR